MGQVTERQGYSKGNIPDSVPWKCSGKQSSENQSTCMYSHLRMPKGVYTSLNLTPTASGEIQILGDSESPAVPPAGAHVPAWYRAAAQLGTAQEGKGF